jgi:23S rRNA-/tRNA-specific pseudouridylate synthase
VGKTYECVCAGSMEPPQGSLRSLLDDRGNKTLVVQRDASGAYIVGATEAVCHYRTLRTMKSRLQRGEGEGVGKRARYYSLLEVSLETDVRDQIRAQLAGCGSPVVGEKGVGRLFLISLTDRCGALRRNATPQLRCVVLC